MQAGALIDPHYLYPARISFSPRALFASTGKAAEKTKEVSPG
jgi:hypothetical protein